MLTLYERSRGGPVDYVGDARMGPLPAGENRLLSFAADNKTKVTVDGGGESRVTKGRIVDGVFHFTRIRQETVTYRIKAPDFAEGKRGRAHSQPPSADPRP